MSSPNNRTLLIIRELINFEEGTLHEAMTAMEKFKENGVLFPIMLEISNFLLFKVPAIRKSRSSFHPYLVSEMNYKEGKEELVDCTKLFTLSEYEKMYNMIGGHAGSYSPYYIRHHKILIEQSLDKLIAEMRMHLRSCLRQSISCIYIGDWRSDPYRW